MSIRFLQRVTGSFTARVFWTGAVMVLLVALFFAGVSIFQQKRWLKKDLVDKGLDTVKSFAHDSRLGVLTEDRVILSHFIKELRDTSEEVTYVTIYNLKGTPLEAGEDKEQFKSVPHTLEAVKSQMDKTGTPLWLETVMNREPVYEFWAPVTLSIEPQDEAVLLEGAVKNAVRVNTIGFVRIGFSLKLIQKRIGDTVLAILALLAVYLPVGLALSYLFARTVTQPIEKLVKLTETVAEGDLSQKIDLKRRDEFGKLADSFNKMLSTITSRNDEISRHRQQLEDMNSALEQRIQVEIAKNREKDQIMIHQGRLSAMGEMLGNIAHQWRQPLNTIGIIIQDLQDISANSGLTAEYLEKNTKKAMELVRHMSKTIDDFRNFFKPDKDRQIFNVKATVAKAVSIVELNFIRGGITIETDMEDNLIVEGYQNEYAHALMNILINAKDALRAGRTKNALIKIKAFRDHGSSVVTVTDNAGGVPEEIKDRIFDPYFTTREKGTGIGLYMTKMILENSMDGKLTVNNTDGGAEFAIVLPLKENP